MDIICQAKSGMGKTAVFVLSTLHLLEPTDNEVHVVVIGHTRELAFQISKEYARFGKYLPQVRGPERRRGGRTRKCSAPRTWRGDRLCGQLIERGGCSELPPAV